MPWLKLLGGFFSVALSALWILHIILYMLFTPYVTTFLNKFLIFFDSACGSAHGRACAVAVCGWGASAIPVCVCVLAQRAELVGGWVGGGGERLRSTRVSIVYYLCACMRVCVHGRARMVALWLDRVLTVRTPPPFPLPAGFFPLFGTLSVCTILRAHALHKPSFPSVFLRSCLRGDVSACCGRVSLRVRVAACCGAA